MPMTLAMAAEDPDIWKETALLVIDMQLDFCNWGGLDHVGGGIAVGPNVHLSVRIARERRMLIVWAVREHDPQGRDVELYRRHLYTPEANDGLGGPVVKDGWGSRLLDGLDIEEGDYKVVKTRFSAFFNTNLHSFLQRVGIKSLYIAGIQTPYDIRQTAFDALALDYQVTILNEATAAHNHEAHHASVKDMERVGIVIRGLEDWMGWDPARDKPEPLTLESEEPEENLKANPEG